MAQPADAQLLREERDGILLLTLHRPASLNALTHGLIQEIGAAVREANDSDAIGGVILTGSGEKAFAAGADISEFAGFSPEQGERLSADGHEVFNAIENGPTPVIAAVNGFALGGGCELAMACHLRIASDNARFGQPEVNLGLIPGYGGTQRLAELVGKGRATELLLTADLIDAAKALDWGLVNAVVPQAELLATAEKTLRKIMAKGPLAVAACIDLINERYRTDPDVGSGYDSEPERFGALMGSEDFAEGTRAFLEKRPAAFKGA
jgi:enoyl-CoA hydratase